MIKLIVEIESEKNGFGIHTIPELHFREDQSDLDKNMEMCMSHVIAEKVKELAEQMFKDMTKVAGDSVQSIHVSRELGEQDSELVTKLKQRLRGEGE
jgi:hypothetical protein